MDRQKRLWQKRKPKTWWKRLPRWLRSTIGIMIIAIGYIAVRRMCTHMICSWPVWTWFVLPVIIMAILAMFLLRDKVLKKKKELKAAFLTIFLGGYMGLLFSGAGHIIFIFTNNMFAYKKPYERMAWVRGKHRITISRGPDKYNTYLFFVDNNERFPLDDFDVFNHVNQGDTVVVTLQDGFWGVPIIKKVDKLISGF